MAFRFDFDPTNRILRGRFMKEVTDSELIDFYRMTALLSESLSPEAGVADFAQATAEVTPDTIRKLAKLPPAFPKQDRPRFIVAASDHIFGLARMFQIEGEATRPNLHIVRSEEEAWERLGVERLEFDSVPRSLLGAFSARSKKAEGVSC